MLKTFLFGLIIGVVSSWYGLAVKGGAQDCPYSYMQDLVAGRYRLPWEDGVVHTDGTSYGFPKPARRYGELKKRLAEQFPDAYPAYKASTKMLIPFIF